MALKSKVGQRSLPARAGRRVSLARPGGGARPGKNRRKQAGPRRSISLPWAAFGRTISIIGFFSLVVILLGGVALGLLYGYRSITSGEYFSLKTLEIKGNVRLSSREILETADLSEGANTLALSIDDVETALAGHPWIEEVSVKRVLPGKLIIGIREKKPAFWMLHEGTLYYADSRGALIGPVQPGSFASLPTLEVEPGAEDAAGTLPDLMQSLADSRLLQGVGAVSLLRLSSARGLEVYVEGLRLKMIIGLEDWLANLQRLALTLRDLSRRGELADIGEIRAQGVNVWVRKHAGG